MISAHDFYNVMSAVVPLYVAMGAAYGSVRWWGLLTPEQCSGINRFVALFAVPLLSFQIISKNNPYTMNPYFVAADGLQKLLVLAVLTGWARWWRNRSGGLEWLITHFMVATLPNTLVMGIPLLRAMYGSHGDLVVQAVVLQCIVWYTLLLFLYEYRAARALILEQFPGGTAASIVSFKVDSDVVSLAAPDAETEAEVGDDGRIHVTVRRSSVSSASARFSSAAGGVGYGHKQPGPQHRSPMASMMSSKAGTPRPSNLTGAEIYSLQSSRNMTPRESNFGRSDLYLVGRASGGGGGDSPATQLPRKLVPARASDYDARELHMFVWSSSASPTSERGGAGAGDFGIGDATVKETKLVVVADDQDSKEGFTFAGVERSAYDESMMEPSLAKLGSSSTVELAPKSAAGLMNGHGNGSGNDEPGLPPASVMTKLILDMVWRKLIRNPNTYSSLIGLVWALVSFRWGLKAPKIVEKSITILSDAGLGMAMFSLGLFMALQSRILACGTYMALFGMLLKFFCGPAIMSVTSIATGLRGLDLRASIVQAALPSGIVPFVFAKEYNVHPDVLSTAVIFGMLVALPITLIYYILLGI